MTGPEHYREAERLLFEAGKLYAGDQREPGLLAEAQIHATLALAAATAANIRRNGAVVGEDSKSDELPMEWSAAIWPTS